MKSIILGSILGNLLIIGKSVINIAGGSPLAPLQNIAINFVYYMLVISLVEEILFRGYIQTRLYGLGKRTIFTIILGGLLFMLMHIPFQMGYAKVGLLCLSSIELANLNLYFYLAYYI